MKLLQAIGNVGADPRITANGSYVVPLAIDNGKTAEGTKAAPLWVNVVGIPKSVVPYVVKGTKIFVSGNMSAKIFNDPAKGAILDITIFCSNLELISSNKEGGQSNE